MVCFRALAQASSPRCSCGPWESLRVGWGEPCCAPDSSAGTEGAGALGLGVPGAVKGAERCGSKTGVHGVLVPG